MTEERIFYEIFTNSLTRSGEEVCGDQVKVLRLPERTIAVLSDGLGSGIKATILARLTTEIIVTMLRAEAPLPEVIQTIVSTLPTCRVRELAYATFVILQVNHADGRFHLVSFDSPAPVLLKQRCLQRQEVRKQTVCGKALNISEGILEQGDFLCLMSDGVLYADEGITMNHQWGWEEVASCLAATAQSAGGSAERIVQSVMAETRRRYGTSVGDDATLVGVLVRKARRLAVFTGPPGDRRHDAICAQRLMNFEGRRVVCGGTTANIVAEQFGEIVRTDESTAREGIPPVGDIPDIDLVTEGILTLARTLELIEGSGGDAKRLPVDRNAAVLLSRELLQADSILFMAGESVNPYYQNPQLPRSVSIRRSLVSQIAQALTHCQKEVTVEWI